MATHIRTQATLNHRESSLGLPALTVPTVVLSQSLLHSASIAARRRLVARPTNLGRDYRPYPVLLPREPVVALRVVAGIGKHGGQLHTPQRLRQQGHEAV